MLLLNIWTYLQNNQISYCFCYFPPEVEEYLQLDEDHEDLSLSFLTSNTINKNCINKDVKSE